MELEGVVHNGVIVPNDATALPEGTRVRITPVPLETPRSFGERFARFKGAAAGLPTDMAKQHDHSRRRKVVTTTELTYGKLDKVLRSLGFSSRLVKGEPPARHYEHKETGAFITIPPFEESERVMEHHLVAVRGTLDGFGIADPTAFAALLQKAR